MHRSHWELAAHVRHHLAYLAAERRICSRPEHGDRGGATPSTRLRHGIGLGLIRFGAALAGHDAVRAFSPSAARPATTVRPGS